MRNLAGVSDADTYIMAELEEAGIECVVHPEPVPHSEVPMRITGKLGTFTFRRAWYYYVVRGGAVPLAVARELYEHPVGRCDVRVDGHCGCPAPTGAVDHYHIDSQAGLSLFVETLRRHGLCPPHKPPPLDLARRIIEMLRDAAKNNEHIPVEYAEKSPMRHECIGRLAAWQEAVYRAEALERESRPGAAATLTDADVAREFFRRFGPLLERFDWLATGWITTAVRLYGERAAEALDAATAHMGQPYEYLSAEDADRTLRDAMASREAKR